MSTEGLGAAGLPAWLEAGLQGLWEAHLGLSLGLLAVALLRRPLRRLAGPQEAYALWLLPLLCVAGTALPDAGLARLMLAPVVWHATMATLDARAQAALPGLSWALVWAVGALLVAGGHWHRHRRFLRALPMDLQDCLRTPRGSSPGLVGVWKPRLLLPLDFEERFTPQERAWVLAHEAQHARRHDNAVRLLAALLQALAWFNPLLWWALPALRHDQELACDASLLRRQPGQWRAYAQALLKTDPRFAVPAVPITASAWQPTHPLKERIEMLKTSSHLPSWRRHLARLGLSAVALLAAGAVQALRSADTPSTPGTQGKSLTAGSVCRVMPKPNVPVVDLRGRFELVAIYEVSPKGEPFNIRIAGEPAFRAAVQESIQGYVCKPTSGGMEVMQEFVFVID